MTRTQRTAAAGGVVGVLVLAAVWMASRDRTESLVSTPLYSDLAASVPSVQRLELSTADQPALELKRNGDTWSVTQREGYPADAGKIGILLQSLAEARIREAKTATATNYPTLGVEDVSTPGATGLRVAAFGADAAAPLLDLVIGKQAGADGTYVRKTGEAASWLVNRLEVSRVPGAWLAVNIAHVDTDRIHQAVLRPAGKPTVTLTKPRRGEADFAAAGRNLTSPKAADGVATGLIALQLEDVRKLDSLSAAAPDARATYRMFDGLTLDITGWKEGEQHWIALTPSFDAALAARFANDKPEDNTGTAIWRTPEQVQQEMDRLVQRVTGWAYRIPAYKYQGVFPATETWLK